MIKDIALSKARREDLKLGENPGDTISMGLKTGKLQQPTWQNNSVAVDTIIKMIWESCIMGHRS